MTDQSANPLRNGAEFWFRPAQTADLAALETLSDTVQKVHSDARPDIFRSIVDSDGRAAFFQSAMDNENWQIWVAGRNEKTLAYALGEVIRKETGPIRHGHSEGHVHQICVDPKARRCGLATGLLKHLLISMRDEKLDRVTAAYWTFNEASESFFTAMGFAPAVVTAELS